MNLDHFSLSELKSVKGTLGLPIEQDLHFELKTLQELMDKHLSDRGMKIKIPETIFGFYFVIYRIFENNYSPRILSHKKFRKYIPLGIMSRLKGYIK